MSSKLLHKIGPSVATLAGMLLAASVATSRAQADSWNKMMLLTVNEPIQVSNTYLEPGTYMFILANSQSDRNIVQIFNKDRSHLINTIMTVPSYRLFPTGSTQISYWETPPGTAKAVRDWFYPGDYYGQEFRYPTNLRQVALVTPAVAPPPPAVATPAPPPAAIEQELTPPQAFDQAQAPAPAEQQVEIAQNTPHNTPQEQNAPQEIAQNQQPAPTPQPQAAEPQTLPQTASPYPLFGLSGLLALGLYAGLRIRPLA